MNCDRAQLAISARMDGEPVDRRSDGLDDHVATCERCRAFAATAERARTAVRIRPAEPVPDLVSRIMGELEALPLPRARSRPGAPEREHVRWRRAMPAAAALVAGALIGSVLVGGPFRARDGRGISANAVVRGVRGASPALESFDGTFRVIERGLAPEVPLRRLDVRMAFLAPQRFRLDVVDRTAYPPASGSASWTPSDVTYIQDAASTFRSGPTGCPAGRPADACPATRTTITSGSTPTDLMVPVTTFGSTDGVHVLGTEQVDGLEVVRIELRFARAQPMLPFLGLDDTWRPFFEGDRVEVILDAEAWVPRRITVYPASSEERRAWELRFGRPVEDPATPILDVVAAPAATEAPDASLFQIPGTPPEPLSVGEVAERVGYPPVAPTFTGDLELTTSLAPPVDRSTPRSLLVYADGLDYLRVGERPGSHAGRLFGSIGPHPMRVVLPGGGIAYYAPAAAGYGRRIAIRGDDTSLFLETNLPRLELFAIAGSIPVQGRP